MKEKRSNSSLIALIHVLFIQSFKTRPMKKSFTLMLLTVIALGVNAQLLLPADFETALADTAWVQIANAGDLPENMAQVANPATDGINASDSCLKIIVLDNADPWVGAYSDYYSPLPFTAGNHTMEMMVYKSVITNCGIKLESGTGENVQVLVPNTKINEWELLTFDMSAAVGYTYNRLVLFVDFPDPRTVGSTCYLDNIAYLGGSNFVDDRPFSNINIYPNPATERITIQYPGMKSVTITNVIGQTIRTLDLEGKNLEVIDVSDLKDGVYMIILETANGSESSRFVKE
jgi:hypothetical protein